MSSHDPIKYLVEQLAHLPGIGERTALRLTLHMLCKDRQLMPALADALLQASEKVGECSECHHITACGDKCSICVSLTRERSLVCIVANTQDLMALESTSEFRGLYHVLHGTLAPMDGVGPKQLRIESFLSRLDRFHLEIKEVIIATPPTVEGEATAVYLASLMAGKAFKITRIASGVPVGGDLQFADRLTLARSLFLRQRF
ncbi:MAG: recombination mediator RecR [bacterium]|nr:recombination mediator RecR [bacterium]